MKTQEMKDAGGKLHGVTQGLLCPADALCVGRLTAHRNHQRHHHDPNANQLRFNF